MIDPSCEQHPIRALIEQYSLVQWLAIGILAGLIAASTLHAEISGPESMPQNYDHYSHDGAIAFLERYGLKPSDLSISMKKIGDDSQFTVIVDSQRQELAQYLRTQQSGDWDISGSCTISDLPVPSASKWFTDLSGQSIVMNANNEKLFSVGNPTYVSFEIFGSTPDNIQFYLGHNQIEPLRLKGRSKDERSRTAKNNKLKPNPQPYRWPGVSTISITHGGDKVRQEEIRGKRHNSLWNGQVVTLSAAGNETVSFNIVLEAAVREGRELSVSFDSLRHKSGAKIDSRSAQGDSLFDYRGRNIELFFVGYQKIEGTSQIGYEAYYDERHVPKALRRPHDANGNARGGWRDRPGADQHFPDIAIPYEAVGKFDIEPGTNQSIWADIFVPDDAPPGLYSGDITIKEKGRELRRIPVQLQVELFDLPEAPAVQTMVHLSQDMVERHLGFKEPRERGQWEQVRKLRDRYFQMLHRHALSGIGHDQRAYVNGYRHPSDDWLPRLNGDLFTPQYGYEGPGEGVGNGVYSVGTYGAWDWKESRSQMWRRSDQWMRWFERNSPDTEVFLYLIDESLDFEFVERHAQWLDQNPGPGSEMMSFATLLAPAGYRETPSLDIVASPAIATGLPEEWKTAVSRVDQNPERRIYFYNGYRPGTGSFATEDDGTALRMIPWAQEKLGIDRWFFWDSTYYSNAQGGEGSVNVFKRAQNFGTRSGKQDPVYGQGGQGTTYSNGDGLLMYPGTDRVFPEESLDLPGPIASLRMKHWRRGIQDIAYLQLAAQVDPIATQKIVQRMVPKVMWENGVGDRKDPTWVKTDISWPSDPEIWEREGRAALAKIIRTRY